MSHTFSTAGVHNVNVTVPDQDGNTNRTSESVAPLTAQMTVGCDGLTCQFDGLGSFGDRPVTFFAWDFGDGNTETGAIVTHTYAESATYGVTLTVTDDGGATVPPRRTSRWATAATAATLMAMMAATASCPGRHQ